MQRGHKHSAQVRATLREVSFTRDNKPRIEALPKGSNHWNWSERPSRLAIHKRIHRKMGKASNYPCVDCGGKARDWSSETEEYTSNPEEYKPRCRKCHLAKDKNWE